MRIGAVTDRMFVVIDHVERWAGTFAQCRDDARNESVAAPRDRALFAIDRDAADEQALAGGPAFLIIDQSEAVGCAREVARFEHLPDVGGIQFAARFVGIGLHVAAEIGLQALGQFQALVLLEHPRHAALAGL